MKDFLRTYLPTFCWLSVNDIIKMMEAYYGEAVVNVINRNSLSVELCQLRREGYVEKRRIPNGDKHNKYQWKAVECGSGS